MAITETTRKNVITALERLVQQHGASNRFNTKDVRGPGLSSEQAQAASRGATLTLHPEPGKVCDCTYARGLWTVGELRDDAAPSPTDGP